jgi:hypothetical protein
LRSGREGPVEADGVEELVDGLPAAPAGEPPKKSRPSKEFPASSCFVDAVVFGGKARTLGVSVVLGLAGGDGISPNISVFGILASVTVVGRVDVKGVCWDDDRSSFAFSWTTLRGLYSSSVSVHPVAPAKLTISSSPSSSPSSSRVAGSGIGPSIVQRLDSYFVRMKFSIFLSPFSMCIVAGAFLV